MIVFLCIFSSDTALSMGTAVQQLKLPAHHKHQNGGNPILTPKAMALLNALRSLSCPCYVASEKPKKNAKRVHWDIKPE